MLTIDSVSVSAAAKTQIAVTPSYGVAASGSEVQVTAHVTTGPDTKMGAIARSLINRVQDSSTLTDEEKSQLIQYVAMLDASVQINNNYGRASAMITVSEMIGAARGTVNKLAMSAQEVQENYQLGRAAFDKGKTQSYTLSVNLQTEALAYEMHGQSLTAIAQQLRLSIEAA